MSNYFDPEEHKYYIDDIEVPGHTSVLPEQEYYVSKQRLEELREQGKEDHSLIKMYFDTREIFNEPMLLALDIMLKEHKEFGEIRLYEKPLFCEKHMFAGTPDLICESAIIDFKRSFNNKYYHALQLAGQYILAMENKVIHDCKNWYIAYYQNSKFRLKSVYVPEAEDMFLRCIDRYYIDQEIQKYLKGESDG